MGIETILFILLSSIAIFLIVYGLFVVRDFYKIEKNLFKYHNIGIILYSGAVFLFFLNFLVFAPISDFEYVFFAFGLYTLPAVAAYYIVKGTNQLANKINPGFVRDEFKYKIYFLFFILVVVLELINPPFFMISLDIFKIISAIAIVFNIIMSVCIVILMFDYKKAFAGLFSKVVLNSLLMIIFFLFGSILVIVSLIPMRYDPLTFFDLSMIRQINAVFGAFIMLVSFVNCHKSLNTFKKILIEG